MQKENRQAQAEAAETARYIWEISNDNPEHPIFLNSLALIAQSFKMFGKKL